tara:strand:- start:232 stop:711 length:480 start_codon:yes stop_codon:yes gene_type:complete
MLSFANNNIILQEIGILLINQDITLSVAESCTGGNIASVITSVPGSSNYFQGGIIAYSNDVKIKQLNVCLEDLKKYSAVSKKVVIQMAEGVKQQFQTDFSLSTSGYAGPEGDDVGLVFIAVARPKKTLVKEFFFEGSRNEIIKQITSSALTFLLSEIKN